MRSTLEPKALAGAWQWPIREGVDTKVEPMQPTFMIMMGMILNQANLAWYESTDIECWADPYPVGSRNIAWELNLTVTGCWRKAAFKFKYPKKPTHSRASAHSVATTAPNWCWWCSWKTWSNMPRASYSRPSLFIFIALKLDLELFARGKKGRIKWRSISLSLQHFQMLSSVSAVQLQEWVMFSRVSWSLD